jgi:hypothetical protein
MALQYRYQRLLQVFDIIIVEEEDANPEHDVAARLAFFFQQTVLNCSSCRSLPS